MKKTTLYLGALLGAGLLLFGALSCSDGNGGDGGKQDGDWKVATMEENRSAATQLSREPFYTSNPETRQAAFSVSSEAHHLQFFGWSEEDDKRFTLNFPEDVSGYDRVILEYRMGCYGQQPGEWDHTTMLWVVNKADGQRYEIARAITPYGNWFDSNWSKTFYLDVTEYLPMLQGETEFHLYYNGWDGTDTRGHTVTTTYHFYEGVPERNVIYTAKLYDSSPNTNTGYRTWAYGVAGHSIEDAERMGRRSLKIPTDVKSLLLRVAITGHGHDQGTFTDRNGYFTRNAAEFDYNYYEIYVNSLPQNAPDGYIFYSNADNYTQAGTYQYDRANWAPGNPINVHWWEVKPCYNKDGEMMFNINLEGFDSAFDDPRAEGVAQYAVEVNLFGYDK